jgi:hypothetical protein
MSENLLDIVKRSFSYLFSERSFQVTENTASPYFDNAMVVVASDDFALRFTRDRGSISVDISSPGAYTPWFQLSLIQNLVCGGDLLRVIELDEKASFLRDNYSVVKAMLSERNIEATAQQLKDLQRERARRMWPNHPELWG